MTEQAKATQAAVDKLSATVAEQATTVQTLKADLAKVSGQPDPQHQHRRNAGPGSDAVKTDC